MNKHKGNFNPKKDKIRNILLEKLKVSRKRVDQLLNSCYRDLSSKISQEVEFWDESHFDQITTFCQNYHDTKPELIVTNEPVVVCLCMVKDAHARVEESIRQFMLQSYKGTMVFVIYNYSNIPKEMDISDPDHHSIFYKKNQYVILINNNENQGTLKLYEDDEPIEEILCDALSFIHELIPQCQVITFWNEHDTYLKKYIQSGVNGWLEAKKIGKEIYLPQMCISKCVGKYSYVNIIDDHSAFISAKYLFNNFKGWKKEELILNQLKKPTYVKNFDSRIPDLSGGILNATANYISDNEQEKVENWMRLHSIGK